MQKIWQWDELCNEITESEDYEDRNPEQYEGWEFAGHLPNGVVLFQTDRHFACEVWAATKEEAHEKFMAYSYYRSFHDDKGE